MYVHYVRISVYKKQQDHSTHLLQEPSSCNMISFIGAVVIVAIHHLLSLLIVPQPLNVHNTGIHSTLLWLRIDKVSDPVHLLIEAHRVT